MNNGLEVVECYDRSLRSLFAVMVAVWFTMNKIITKTPYIPYLMKWNTGDSSQHLFDTVSTKIQHYKNEFNFQRCCIELYYFS